LEVVLQGLHDSEIRCGIQNEPPAGGITAWIDYGDRAARATFYVSHAAMRSAAGQTCRSPTMVPHETALRLFPDSPYAKEAPRTS
jgi:hypothetical protein